MTESMTTAYFADGRHIDVPEDSAYDWRDDVRNENTTLGLADWYTDNGQENLDDIKGDADPDTLCNHDEFSHIIVNESQTGPLTKDKPMRMIRVCHRRPCILDAMAWVERGTGEPAAWAGPGTEYSFEVPKQIPGPTDAIPSAPGA